MSTTNTEPQAQPNTVEPWRLYESALECDRIRTIYIWGPPGLGKTWGAYNFGRVDDSCYAVTLTDETSATELRGHFLVRGSETVWHDGPFVGAMRSGRRLVINEIGNASPDVMALLFPILESRKTARITLPTGETVFAAPGFHVVATDNRAPDQLPDALNDRFETYVRVSEPHPDALAVLEPTIREYARIIAKVDDDRRVSVRAWMTLQNLLEPFGLEAALHLVFGPERGRVLHDAIRMAEVGRSRTRPGGRK